VKVYLKHASTLKTFFIQYFRDLHSFENVKHLIKLLKVSETRGTGIWWLSGREAACIKYKHDLSPDSLVLDIGGYLGDFSREIFERYKANIHIYEPVEDFYKTILNDDFFSRNSIQVNNFGIGGKSENVMFSISENASGYNVQTDTEKQQLVKIKDVSEEFNKFNKIALVKLNVEGSEYEILERLIETNQLAQAESYLIQFHNFYPDSASRRDAIASHMKEKFYRVWNFDFVWELWKLK
jgi:FkbM family methyltransferase